VAHFETRKDKDGKPVEVLVAPEKSWPGARKLADQLLNKKVKQAESTLNLWISQMTEIWQMKLELYERVPKTDSLYGYSPLGDQKVIDAVRAHIAKRGGRPFDWIKTDKEVFGGVHNAPTFSQAMEDAIKWVMKFENWTPPEEPRKAVVEDPEEADVQGLI
jgi:hypothetical protein